MENAETENKIETELELKKLLLCLLLLVLFLFASISGIQYTGETMDRIKTHSDSEIVEIYDKYIEYRFFTYLDGETKAIPEYYLVTNSSISDFQVLHLDEEFYNNTNIPTVFKLVYYWNYTWPDNNTNYVLKNLIVVESIR